MVVSHLIHISGFGKLLEPPFFHCLNGVQHSCRDRLPPEFVRDRRMKKRPVPEGCEVSGRVFRSRNPAGLLCFTADGPCVRFCLGDFGPGVEKCTALRRCSSSSSLPSSPPSQQSPSLAASLCVGFRGGRQQVAAFAAGHEKSRRPRRGLRDTFSGLRRIRTCRLRRY